MSIIYSNKPKALSQSLSLRNFWVVIEFELRSIWGNKAGLIQDLFLNPLAYVGFFAAGLSGMAHFIDFNNAHNVSYLTFAYPGILGLQLLRLFTLNIYRLTVERRWGLQGLKFAAGTGHLAYISAMLVIPVLMFCVQAIVAFPLAYYLGATTTIKNFFLTMATGALAACFWVSLALLIAFTFKKYSTRDLFLTFSILPLTLASPAFYLLDKAPKYIQSISKINPLSYQILALRDAFINGNFSQLIVLNLVMAIIVVLSAFWQLRSARYLPSET